MLRTQIDADGRGQSLGRSRRGRNAPVPEDSSEDKNAFHPGQPFADALAGPATEGEVGELWTRGLAFFFKPPRIETVGLVPESRIAVDQEL